MNLSVLRSPLNINDRLKQCAVQSTSHVAQIFNIYRIFRDDLKSAKSVILVEFEQEENEFNLGVTMTTEKRFSLIANNYPSFLDINPAKLNPYKYMSSRKKNDNAESLWRVHNTLYDLTKFIDRHPGGADWIELTKGTDITEAFEVHHINYAKVEKMLRKYRVRDAESMRNFKFTFKETGFYRTLRGRVAEKIKTLNLKQAEFMSKVIIDVLLALTFITAIFSAKFDNRYLMLLSGICMCYTVIAAHNFFHRRDNFRMFYFNLGFYNYKDWRISHAMSHHLYPNSLYDLEIIMFEPFFCWIPSPVKNFAQRFLSWFYSPIIYALICLNQFTKRIIFSIAAQKNLFKTDDLIPFTVPLAMFIFGNSDPFTVFKVWMQIILSKSFVFHLIGINGGHHHPDNVHDGDKIRDDLDWGIYTIDTILDNSDVRKHHVLALTHFGHHALHHFFPTLDHGILSSLYPILFDTMNEFEVELRAYPWYKHVVGQFQQLARNTPMTIDSLEKFRSKHMQKKMD